MIPVNSDYVQADEGIEIWVWDHGVHTNFVLPVKNDLVGGRRFASDRVLDRGYALSHRPTRSRIASVKPILMPFVAPGVSSAPWR